MNSSLPNKIGPAVRFRAALIMIGILICHSAHADVVTIGVLVDGEVQGNRTPPIIDDSGGDILTQRANAFGESRGIFEFDLSVIPTGATINSATFEGKTLTYASSQPSEVIELFSYTQNPFASVELADFSRSSVNIGVLEQDNGMNNGLADGELFSHNLTNLNDLQNAIDMSDIFGIRSQTVFGPSWSVYSLENGTGEPATSLTINFTAVPEPAVGSLWALGTGLLFLGRRRRKNIGG